MEYCRALVLRVRGHFRHRSKKILQDFMLLWANYCRAMRQDEPLQTRGTKALQAVRRIARSVSPVKVVRRAAGALRNVKGSPVRSWRSSSPSADEVRTACLSSRLIFQMICDFHQPVLSVICDSATNLSLTFRVAFAFAVLLKL
jgi:hypothetical protein